MKDISLHLLDIVRNSIVANSSLISVEIIENLNVVCKILFALKNDRNNSTIKRSITINKYSYLKGKW